MDNPGSVYGCLKFLSTYNTGVKTRGRRLITWLRLEIGGLLLGLRLEVGGLLLG